MQWWFALLVQLLFSYLATVAFAIIINVPRKALNLAGWAGMMGWLAYWLLMEVGSGRMMANLVGAFVIGLCGIFLRAIRKCRSSFSTSQDLYLWCQALLLTKQYEQLS